MGGFKNYRDPFGLEFAFQQIGNCFRHPLLHLGPSRHNINHASKFAQPDDLAIGEIADVGHPYEWQQVVFAGAVETDIANQDDFIVIFAKKTSSGGRWDSHGDR